MGKGRARPADAGVGLFGEGGQVPSIPLGGCPQAQAGSLAHLRCHLGEAEKSKQAISFPANETQHPHGTCTLSADCVATPSGRGAANPDGGWAAAAQDGLPLQGTGGHTEPPRGEGGERWILEDPGQPLTPLRPVALQPSPHPLPDTPHATQYISVGPSQPLISQLVAWRVWPQLLSSGQEGPYTQGQVPPCGHRVIQSTRFSPPS